MAEDKKFEGEQNFPGLDAARDMFDIFNRALIAQTGTWNDAWQSILRAEYGSKESFKTLALMHQQNMRTLEEVLRYPLTREVQTKVPGWVNLDLSVSDLIHGPIERSARTRSRSHDSKLVCTDLAPFGIVNARFKVRPYDNQQDSDRVDFVVYGWSFEEKKAPYDRDEYLLTAAADRAILEKRPDLVVGQYLGMIYDARQPSEAPLLVVTLRLRA